jgi:hypothetical protein
VTDPVRRQIDSAAVSAQLYALFNHLFAVDLEFDLIVGGTSRGFFFLFGLDVVMLFLLDLARCSASFFILAA